MLAVARVNAVADAHTQERVLTHPNSYLKRLTIPAPLPGALALLLAAFIPASIAWPQLGGGILALLGLVGIVIALRDPASAREVWRRTPAGPIVGILVGMVNLVWVLGFGATPRHLAWAPFMLVPFIAICFVVAERGAIWYSRGAVVACWVALGLILYQMPRDEFDTSVGLLNVIVFGQLAAVAALQALAAGHEPSVASLRAALMATLAGVCATLLSGVRGAIVVLPIVLGVAWPARRPLASVLTRRPRLVLAAALIGGAALVAVWSVSPVNERFARAWVEVSDFVADRPADGSVSLRLVQWRAAVDIIQAHPLAGVGPGGFKGALSALQGRGLYPAGAPLFDHPHNTYLSVATRYGLPVLVGLVAAFVWVWRSLGGAPAPVAVLGRSLLLAWALMGLWNDLLSHQSSVRGLVYLLALLCCPGVVAGAQSVESARSGPRSG